MRRANAALSIALFGSVLFSGAAAGAATTPAPPAAGSVSLFATPSESGNGDGTIVLTGAVGDYGKITPNMDKDGKVDPNGDYGEAILQKGTIEVNLTKFNAVTNNAQPSIDKTTCSAAFTGTGPVTFVSGTGLYKGISGTLDLTATFAAIFPRFATGKDKGQCNLSNSAQPVAEWGSITGKGTVSFS